MCLGEKMVGAVHGLYGYGTLPGGGLPGRPSRLSPPSHPPRRHKWSLSRPHLGRWQAKGKKKIQPVH